MTSGALGPIAKVAFNTPLWVARAFAAVSMIFSVIVLAFGYPIPMLLTIIPAILFSTIILVWWPVVRSRSRRFSVMRAAVAATVTLLAAAIGFGMQGGTTGRAVYVEAANSSGLVEDGWYGILGETDSALYLLPCDRSRPVLAVSPASVLRYTYAPQRPAVARTSAVDWLQGERLQPFGFDPGCDGLAAVP